ncbi:MAG: AAA family ATPase [Cyanobacteria bacterium P01_C01_bin.38]
MFKNIKIENFRCFESFELKQLGRVNLLVGENNSGKTSILEAIQLLCSRTNLEPLSEMMIHRGEYFWDDNDKKSRELDIKHLFHERKIEPKTKLSISGMRQDNNSEQLNLSIVRHPESLLKLINDFEGAVHTSSYNLPESTIKQIEILKNEFEKQVSFTIDNEFFNNWEKLEFSVEWTYVNLSKERKILLSPNRCLDVDVVYHSSRDLKNQFVTSSSLTTQRMIELFDRVALTNDEKLILEALQTIEPDIERIASVNPYVIRNSFESRSGFVVRLSDRNQRVPIGSMGDGVWRMLGLALAIVCAQDGVLFVDEIDTGLHFTAMSDMWKLVWETAKRLNVQVFATTHNSDCWKSLASIAREVDAAEDGITIQRVEKDKNIAVSFNQREIVIAAEREIEVR